MSAPPWSTDAIVAWQVRYARATYGSRWQRKKRKAKKAAGHRCQAASDLTPDGRCLNTSDLTVHHLTYEHMGHERPWELVVLCNSCHRELHLLERAQRKLQREMQA